MPPGKHGICEVEPGARVVEPQYVRIFQQAATGVWRQLETHGFQLENPGRLEDGKPARCMGGTVALVAEPDVEPSIGDRLKPNAWNPDRSLGWFRDCGPHASGGVAKPTPEHHELAIPAALYFAESVRWYAGQGFSGAMVFFATRDRSDLGGLGGSPIVADHE